MKVQLKYLMDFPRISTYFETKFSFSYNVINFLIFQLNVEANENNNVPSKKL